MWYLELKEFLSDIFKYILTAVIVILIILYVVSVQQVVGPSMSPTLKNGDIALLNKAIYHFSKIKRNDIVSLNYEDTKYLIKRVIGLPGETIEFKDNILYIDGQAYKESFIADYNLTEDFKLSDLGYEKIPDDMYLVLGDNRDNSMDSRTIGLIKKKDIKGRVFLRIWPLNRGIFIK